MQGYVNRTVATMRDVLSQDGYISTWLRGSWWYRHRPFRGECEYHREKLQVDKMRTPLMTFLRLSDSLPGQYHKEWRDCFTIREWLQEEQEVESLSQGSHRERGVYLVREIFGRGHRGQEGYARGDIFQPEYVTPSILLRGFHYQEVRYPVSYICWMG